MGADPVVTLDASIGNLNLIQEVMGNQVASLMFDCQTSLPKEEVNKPVLL